MAVADQEWTQLEADLEPGWDMVFPNYLDIDFVNNITSLEELKVVTSYLVRVLRTIVVPEAIEKGYQTQVNLLTNRIDTAKIAYQNDNPEFSKDDWDEIPDNTTLWTMLEPYDATLGADHNRVYGVLESKRYHGKEKIANIRKKLVDVTAKKEVGVDVVFK